MSKIFMKLGKIIGASTEPGHVQWIGLLSCDLAPLRRGVRAVPLPPPGGTHKKPQEELWCSKAFDASSGPLFRIMHEGSTVESGTVEFVDGDGVMKSAGRGGGWTGGG